MVERTDNSVHETPMH